MRCLSYRPIKIHRKFPIAYLLCDKASLRADLGEDIDVLFFFFSSLSVQLPEPREEKLKRALKFTGDAYEGIGQLCEAQPKHDWEPVGDKLHEYRGMLLNFPEVLQVHKVSDRRIFDFLLVSSLFPFFRQQPREDCQ